MSAFGRLCCKSAVDALRPRRRVDRVRRERRMNPKCQTRPGFDTFSAKSADLTGLKMRRITAPFQLIELHATLNEPGPYRRISQFVRISQKVTKRFYNLLAVGEGRPPLHCARFRRARF